MKLLTRILLFGILLSTSVYARAADPSISPSGTRNICTGDSLQLSITNAPGGNRFLWVKDGVNLLNDTLSSLKVFTSGVYTVKLISGTDTTSLTPVTVNVRPSPVASFSFTNPSGCGNKNISFTN